MLNAGLIARTVADVKFLDTVFSNCPRVDAEIDLDGYRIGIAREWFLDLGDEVSMNACTLVTMETLDLFLKGMPATRRRALGEAGHKKKTTACSISTGWPP